MKKKNIIKIRSEYFIDTKLKVTKNNVYHSSNNSINNKFKIIKPNKLPHNLK